MKNEIQDIEVNKNIKTSIFLVILIIISIFAVGYLFDEKEVYDNTLAIVVSKGDDYYLDSNSDNLVWKSSDENIAFVSIDGVVTGINNGEVVITASKNDEIYYQYNVIVRDNYNEKDIVTTTQNGNVDDTMSKEEISINNISDKKEEISSDNDLNKKEDNNNQSTNEEYKEDVKNIIFDEEIKTIYVGDKYQTSLNITSDLHDEEIKYISSDTNVATISGDGLITGKKEGTVIIKAILNNIISIMKIFVKEIIDSKVLTVNFDSNGSDSIGNDRLQCETNGNSCTIKFPTINRDGYNIIGWSRNPNANKAEYKVGEEVNVNGNTTYYAITSKDLTATFEGNGANISYNTNKCTLYNKEESCSVVTPSITRDNYSVLGWGIVSDASDVVSSSSDIITISSDSKYYAITKINKDGIEKGCTGWMAVNNYYYSSNSTSSSRKKISAGTGFTIEGVEGSFFKVSIPGVSGEKYIRHKYVMINLSDYIPSMHFEIANASASIYKSSGYNLEGVTGNRLYESGKVYNVRLRREEYMAPILYSAAKKLLVAQNNLLSQGYSIKVYDVYRPSHVSKEIYISLNNLYKSNSVVRNNILYSYGKSGTTYYWDTGWFLAPGLSTHNTGSAIDMSLVYTSNGKEVVMPTDMHELSTKAIKYYSPNVSRSPSNYSKEMNDGAKILDKAATSAGLTTLASEWWHFQDGSAHNFIKGIQSSGCNFEVTRVYSY